MSLNIVKKKSSFKPKAAPRRPRPPAAAAVSASASIAASAASPPSPRASVERLLQAPVLSVSETSVDAQNEGGAGDEIPHAATAAPPPEHSPETEPPSTSNLPATPSIDSDLPNDHAERLASPPRNTYNRSTPSPHLQPTLGTTRTKLPSEVPSHSQQSESDTVTTPAVTLKRKQFSEDRIESAEKRLRISDTQIATADTANHPHHESADSFSHVENNDIQVDQLDTPMADNDEVASSIPSNTQIRDDVVNSYPDPEVLSQVNQLGSHRSQPSDGVEGNGIDTTGGTPLVSDPEVSIAESTKKSGKKKSARATKTTSKQAKQAQTTAEGETDEDDNLSDIREAIVSRIKKTRKSRKDGSKDGINKRKPRKMRDTTPEGAEDEVLDPQGMTMADLCKDTKIGPKFSRHDEIKKRLQEQKNERKRLKAIEEKKMFQTLTDDEAEGNDDLADVEQAEGSDDVRAEPTTRVSEPSPEPDTTTLPTVQVIGNRLIIDPSSLQINRNAQAEAERGIDEVVRVDDFSKVFTQQTHMKVEKFRRWTEEEDEKFVEFLRRFGTDFTTMSLMFGRSRTVRQCKLRYNKLEKANPGLLDRIARREEHGQQQTTGPANIPKAWNPPEKIKKVNENGEVVTDEDGKVVFVEPELPPPWEDSRYRNAAAFKASPDEEPPKYRREIEASIGERLQPAGVIMQSFASTAAERELEELNAKKAVETERERKREEIKSRGSARGTTAAAMGTSGSISGSARAKQILDAVSDDEATAPKARRKAPGKGKAKNNPHSSAYSGGGTEVVLETIES